MGSGIHTLGDERLVLCPVTCGLIHWRHTHKLLEDWSQKLEAWGQLCLRVGSFDCGADEGDEIPVGAHLAIGKLGSGSMRQAGESGLGWGRGSGIWVEAALWEWSARADKWVYVGGGRSKRRGATPTPIPIPFSAPAPTRHHL